MNGNHVFNIFTPSFSNMWKRLHLSCNRAGFLQVCGGGRASAGVKRSSRARGSLKPLPPALLTSRSVTSESGESEVRTTTINTTRKAKVAYPTAKRLLFHMFYATHPQKLLKSHAMV